MIAEVGQVVEVFLPADRHTGRPRGFAFVELADEAAAAEAIEKFNEQEFKGRKLRVTEAEDRPRPAPRSFNDGPPQGRTPGYKKAGKPKGSRRNLRGKKRSL